MYWVGQEGHLFFPYIGSSSAYFSLTSFKTVLLDCIVTAVIVACIKKASKLVNFCITILIFKIEENTQHFWHIMLYYFKKGKNSTETHTQDVRSVQLQKEKVL